MGDNKLTSRECTDDKISKIEKFKKYEEADFDKSKEYAEMAKKLSENIHYEQGVAIADLYIAKAEKYYAESLNIRLEYDIQGICVNYLNLAEVSYYSEDHNKALKYIEKAYESAKSSNYNSVMPEV